nr:transposase [Suicoccus acidiformans]
MADESVYTLNEKKIAEEAKYDGFYCVCTNLEGDTERIVAINPQRWEIEESFRIMKTEFKARPVYLHRDTRIETHFLVCFIALLVYRIISQLLGNQYTCSEILQCLEEMRWFEIQGEGYIPAYQRTHLMDLLHSIFPFRTDYQFIGDKEFNEISIVNLS